MIHFLIAHFINPHAPKAQVRKQYGKLASLVGILINLALSGMKIFLGWFTHSISILGDGMNNLFDAGAATISLFSFYIASKPADKDHPFGHARFEYISSSLVAVLILYAAISLFRSSLDKIFHPIPVDLKGLGLLILLVSIAAKVWLYFFYKKLGRQICSDLILANATDSLADVLSTSTILLALILSHFTDLQLDGVMGIVLSFIILKSGIEILKNTFDHLMGTRPDPENVKELEAYLLSFNGVLGVHDLIVHDYGPGRKFVTVHIEVDADTNVLESHALMDRIERQIKEEEGIQLTAHMDPLEVHDPRTKELKKTINKILKELHPAYSLHDFRVIDSQDYTNVIFDVLVPAEERRTDAEIQEKIKAEIQAYDPMLVPVLEVDRDYLGLEEEKANRTAGR